MISTLRTQGLKNIYGRPIYLSPISAFVQNFKLGGVIYSFGSTVLQQD